MERLFITGDTHGELQTRRLVSPDFFDTVGKNLSKNDYVVVLGDFNLMQTVAEKEWIEILTRMPWTTLFVEGNHDNHPMLNELKRVPFKLGIAGKINDSILHLRRGEIYEIAGKKIFTFGGATSIDNRKPFVDWWPEETCSYAETEYAISMLERVGNRVDIILSHTAPKRIVDMRYKEWVIKCPVSAFLEFVCDTVNFEALYCGHFHTDWDVGKYHILWDRILEIS